MTILTQIFFYFIPRTLMVFLQARISPKFVINVWKLALKRILPKRKVFS